MLGVLVFVHELGHFLAAKRVGIRVLKFQLGFNPTILSFRRGDTEYGIGALPLGGYVKMAGESTEDEPRPDNPTSSCRRRKWERFQVLIMGPVMNLLLAFVLTAVVLYQGARSRRATKTSPSSSAPWPRARRPQRADIVPGDRIVSVAGHRVDNWEQFFVAIGARPNREISVGLLRERPRRHTQADAGRRGGTEPVRDRRHRRAAERAPAPRCPSTPASRATAAA